MDRGSSATTTIYPTESNVMGTHDPITLLWLFRILVPLGGHKKFIQATSFKDERLAEAIGLGHWINPIGHDFDPKKVNSELRQLHQKAEKQWGDYAVVSPILQDNIEHVSQLVGLSVTDCKLLAFAVSIHNDCLLADVADLLGEISTVKMYFVLSVILGAPEDDIRTSMNSQGLLAQSGLVSVVSVNIDLRDKLQLISNDFAEMMASTRVNAISLLRGTVSAASAGHLNLDSYSHINDFLHILQPYLRHAISEAKPGVNILLHGVPGTGKSQLVRALARELGYNLFEVASEDFTGDPIDAKSRLRAFRAAQSFLTKSGALIVFDEIQDVFDDGDYFSGRKSTAQKHKAWINRMLEENPVPTLWLSNTIDSIDPAFIRRFDIVFELPVPPQARREDFLRSSCSDMLDTGSIRRIAEVETLAPAVVAKAASVVRLIKHELGPQSAASAFERLINNTLEAQGHKSLRHSGANRLPEVYDPAFIQADANLAKVALGLKNSRSGRLCLYGPPGTGKTAYGHWLAKQLEMPLRVKRASDLVSMFLGETERNIARAFRQAEQDGALLLIDEVDSFLQDRRGAQRSWEVSEVNEMLTQMESFGGVFIASTNLMGNLDQAALRRFDLKVKFDFLQSAQSLELFMRYATMLDLPEPPPSVKAGIMRLTNLTPGDFAAVIRQSRFRPIESPAMLLATLEAECAVKEGGKSVIGFM